MATSTMKSKTMWRVAIIFGIVLLCLVSSTYAEPTSNHSMPDNETWALVWNTTTEDGLEILINWNDTSAKDLITQGGGDQSFNMTSDIADDTGLWGYGAVENKAVKNGSLLVSGDILYDIGNLPINHSVCFWLNASGQGTASRLIDHYTAVGTNYPIAVEIYQGNVWWTHADEAVLKGSNVVNSTWNHVCLVANFSGSGNTEKNIYIDGQTNTTSSTVVATDLEDTPVEVDFLLFPSWGDGNAEMDDFLVFNYSLTSGQVKDIYTGNFKLTSPPDPDTLNVSTPEPLNLSQFNVFPISINITSVNSSTLFNATLWLNGSINESKGYVGGIETYVEFNVTFPDGTWNYRIELNNTLMGYNSSNITIYTDETGPAIEDGFVNQTIFWSNSSNLIEYQWNLTDNFMLFSYNFSVDNRMINSSWNYMNTTDWSFNLSYATQNLSIGNHTFRMRVADGHTANSLGGDYGVRNGLFNDYLKFNFWDGGWVRMENDPDSWFDEWTAEKLSDRYSFTFEPNKIQEQYNFIVTSYYKIHILEKEGLYGGQWLVMGDHWLDFYLPNEPTQNIHIERLGEKRVVVSVWGLKNPTTQLYSSVGDLNVVVKDYNFSVTNATLTYENNLMEYSNTIITFAINKTSDILSTNAILWYDSNLTGTTKTSYSNYDLYSATFNVGSIDSDLINKSFNWNYTIYGNYNNLSDNMSGVNQTLYKIGIDNCTSYEQRAINMTIRYENNDSLTNEVEMAGYFEGWVEIITDHRSFNLSWTNDNTYGICIYPNWTSYNMSGQLEYDANISTYAKKTYYFTNITLDNQTDQLSLYVTNGTTTVKFTVLDENDDKVKDVKIKVLSYDLVTDSYKVTEIINTDSDGEAFAEIILNTQWYKFILEYDNKIVFESEETKITTTAKTFRIVLGTDYFADYTNIMNTHGDVSFDNSTLTFTFVFTDTTGNVDTGCLDITRRSINGDIHINETCVTSSAASIDYTITESVVSNMYVGVGYVTINGEQFVLDTESVSFDFRWKTWGLEGIFVSFLLILTLVMVGVAGANPAVAVFLMMIGFIGSILMTILFINWYVLVIFIIMGFITIYKVGRRT